MGIEAATFHSDLGALCHQRTQGAVFACAITTLDHSQILFTNCIVDDDQQPLWAIRSVNVYSQRFWSTSTATIRLTAHLPSYHRQPPQMPIYAKEMAGETFNFRLQPEDEICIYKGYVTGVRPITPEDIERNRLLRVYVGVVDTISGSSTPQGVSVAISCRDRVRYLMDTFVSLSPLETGDSIDKVSKSIGSYGDTDAQGNPTQEVKRSELILKVAQMGIGYVELASTVQGAALETVQYVDPGTGRTVTRKVCNVNGKGIDRGFVQDLQDLKVRGAAVRPGEVKAPDYFYKCKKGKADNYIPLVGKTENEPLDINPKMKFNLMVGRLGFQTEKLVKNFSIENQIPIEFIKFLANQEPYPTELFMNHSDGQFYYTPRTNDPSGLGDPKRYYRTYYCRNVPEEVGDPAAVRQRLPEEVRAQALQSRDRFDSTGDCLLPPNFAAEQVFAKVDRNQILINFKEEFSTAALKTNFIVANASPSSEGGTATQMLHLAARPSFLRGREIAGRTMYVIDETIENPSEAAAVAASLARATAKELKSASMVILGDPSIVPGEIVQIIGSPLYPESLDLGIAMAERRSYLEYEKINNASYYNLLEAIRVGGASQSAALLNIDGTYDNSTASPNYDAQVPDPNKKIVPKTVQGKGLSSSLDVICAITKNETSTVVRDLGGTNRANLSQLESLRQQFNTARTAQPPNPVRVKQLEDQIKKLEGSIRENTVPRDYSGGWDDNPKNPIWRRSGFTQEPRSIWRVEGVRHNWSADRGFTSEVVLLSAFN